MTKLIVVQARQTGHVLAAVTQTAVRQASQQTVAEVVGSRLPVLVASPRPTVATVTVPADQLAVTTVDPDDKVLEDPSSYEVVEVQQGTVTVQVLQVLGGGARIVTTTITSAGATVSYPLPADNVAHRVLLVLEQLGPPKLLSGSIPAGARQAVLPIALDPGKWRTLTLVGGFRPRASELTVQ
jgi:hypothetical protein